MRFNKRFSLSSSLTATLAATLLVASNTALCNGTAADLGGPISINGNIGGQVIYKDYNNKTTTRNFYEVANLKLTAELSENVRAVIMFRIRQDLEDEGIPPQTFEQMLSEAYIRIDNVGGKPVAFVFGKQTIPFGNFQNKQPNFELDPIVSTNYQRDVIGFTVQLEDTGFFDLIEASVFETTPKDLRIGEVDGASVRLTKDVSEKVKVISSAMHKGNGAAKDTNTETLGFMFKDGGWTLWSEGIYMDGNVTYPNARWAATAGAEYRFDKKQRVVVASSYIADTLTRIGLSYELEVSSGVFITPEVAYVVRPDGTSEVQYIIRTDVRFSTK